MTTTLGTASSPAETLLEPFVDNLPVGWTTVGGNAGTCTQATVSTTQITVPAGATLPAGGCTIVVLVSAGRPAHSRDTTGTLLTAYPTQAFPMTLSYGGNTVWAANFYLTMMGSADDYSIGPCPATANCIGSGLPNPVAWDTVKVPNFLERQGGALSISGGLATQGPPFGSTVNYLANVSVSFTPVPNKLAAPVVFPGAGLPRSARLAASSTMPPPSAAAPLTSTCRSPARRDDPRAGVGATPQRIRASHRILAPSARGRPAAPPRGPTSPSPPRRRAARTSRRGRGHRLPPASGDR